MIHVTTMSGKKILLNCEHIEKVEEVPETLITLINGKKYIVLEDIDDLEQKVLNYKNLILSRF